MKVVINDCFGGFSLSEAAARAYFERKGKEFYVVGDGLMESYFDAPMPPEFMAPPWEFLMPMDHPHYAAYNEWCCAHNLYDRDIPRDDPDLIGVVEELGEAADGRCASLKIVEIPDGVEWQIEEYDGNEHVAEKHRTWS